METKKDTWKVGELAKRTGLSVRTLHFYEEIGLLRPSARSEAGHRLYGSDDLARLQRILSLRALGLPLEEIGDLIDRRPLDAGSPGEVLRRHAASLRARIAEAQELAARLERLAGRLDAGGGVDVDDLLHCIEETVMFERYYSEEQLAALEKKRQELGPEGMQRMHDAWAALIAEAKEAHAAGRPADDPAVEALARRWKAMIEQFTMGDSGIREGVDRMWRENADALASRSGLPVEVARWIGEAMRRLG